jgi:membrane-associated phospholipid phosphatase
MTQEWRAPYMASTLHPPATTRRGSVAVARQGVPRAGRYVLLFVALVLLLLPRSVWSSLQALILVGPIAWTALRWRNDRSLTYWCAFIASFLVAGYFRDIGDTVGPVFYRYPLEADRLLFFGAVPTTVLQSLLYTPGAPAWWDWAGLGIYLTHYVSLPVMGALVWWKRPAVLRPFLLGAAAMTVLAGVCFVMVSTAPPWIAAQHGLLPPVYKPVLDLLTQTVPGVYHYGVSIAGGNDVAAMPSGHAAVATFAALVTHGTRWAWLGLGYALAMGFVLVYFGEHYVVDILAGALLAVGCWRLTSCRARESGPA